MSKKYIQFPSFLFPGKNKPEAIAGMEEYVNEHAEEFRDGEEITIKYYNKYYDETGNTVEVPSSCNAVIHTITENNEVHFKVYAEVGEEETMKIVDGEEPEDRDSLWLTDWSEGDIDPSGASDLKGEIRALKKELRDMKKIVEMLDYALKTTLSGGDIIVNSQKYDLENAYTPEQPADSTYDPEYDTGNTAVTSFELFIGKSPLSSFASTNLYMNQNYFLKLKTYNSGMKEVDPSGTILNITIEPSSIAEVKDGNVLFASNSGNTIIHARLTTQDNEIILNNYSISFAYNEEPYYPEYEEPNVHHMLIKKADTLAILIDNADYLCAGEFCWCIAENALYLKAQSANGTMQLFKINGGGSVTPTGSTITYDVDGDGVFIATSDDDSVNVDSEGYLNLIGVVDENGIMILNDTTTD